MRRLAVPTGVLLAAVALLALLGFGVAHQGENTSLDSQLTHGKRPPAPSYTVALPRLGTSDKQSLAALRGKVVVLNVFASWCQPCAAEAPILDQEQESLVGHDATILGVTYLDNSVDSERFVRHWHITYPVVRDVDGSFVRSFGSNGVPETFVIDRQGHIAAIRRYQLDSTWLAQTLPPILAGRS